MARVGGQSWHRGNHDQVQKGPVKMKTDFLGEEPIGLCSTREKGGCVEGSGNMPLLSGFPSIQFHPEPPPCYWTSLSFTSGLGVRGGNNHVLTPGTYFSFSITVK